MESEEQRSRQPIRVAIVDDHPGFARGLAELLSSVADDIDVVGTAVRSERAVALVQEHHPDVVLLDLRMQGRDGIEVTKELHEKFSSVRVLVLTVSDEPEDAQDALAAGARGFISKEMDVEEIAAALRLVRSDHIVVSARVASSLLSPSDILRPTEFERELLKLVAEGHDNSEIAEALSISMSTLKRNLQKIMTRLGIHTRAEAAAYAARRRLL